MLNIVLRTSEFWSNLSVFLGAFIQDHWRTQWLSLNIDLLMCILCILYIACVTMITCSQLLITCRFVHCIKQTHFNSFKVKEYWTFLFKSKATNFLFKKKYIYTIFNLFIKLFCWCRGTFSVKGRELLKGQPKWNSILDYCYIDLASNCSVLF